MEEMVQTDIYYFLCDEFKITKKIRLIELFAGVGSQAMALRNIGAEFEHYKVVEFDKYAIKSYNAIHGTNFEPLDITQIHADDLEITDTEKYDYILTYSFPCQSLSVAGKQEGMAKGSGTRSGLLWEVERLLNECQELPKVLLMENVPQVHSMKNIEDFKKWIEFLEKKGYSNYYEDLNAKNYGMPQNRNRCFMVSILGEYKYEFPKPVELDLRLKDMLENQVDEKYFINKKWHFSTDEDEKHDSNEIAQIDGFYYKVTRSITDTNKICRTLDTMCGGQREPKIIDGGVIIPEATKKGYAEAFEGDSVNLEQPNSKTRRGRVGKQVAQTLTTSCNQGVVEKALRIRKLTPKECWRLMGFNDEDFEKASKVNSNSQLYKQAGNSIVVNVLEAIFKQMI